MSSRTFCVALVVGFVAVAMFAFGAPAEAGVDYGKYTTALNPKTASSGQLVTFTATAVQDPSKSADEGTARHEFEIGYDSKTLTFVSHADGGACTSYPSSSEPPYVIDTAMYCNETLTSAQTKVDTFTFRVADGVAAGSTTLFSEATYGKVQADAAPATLVLTGSTSGAQNGKDCRPLFVGLRGSGEEPAGQPAESPTRMGKLVNFLYLDVQTKTQQKFQTIDPDAQMKQYQAVAVGPRAVTQYRNSAAGGKNLALSSIRALIARCGSQAKFLLAGYSQGAGAIDDTLRELTSDERSRVAGVALFGNPQHTPFVNGDAGPLHTLGIFSPAKSLPDGLPKRMRDYCYYLDPVCSAGPAALANPYGAAGGLVLCELPWTKAYCTHEQYLGSSEDSAAQFLAQQFKNFGP